MGIVRASDDSCNNAAALAAMTVGTVSWLAEPWLRDGMGLVLPVGLSCAVCALVAYLGVSRVRWYNTAGVPGLFSLLTLNSWPSAVDP